MVYGFIVPLPQGKDTSNETFENSKVRHLINDLLREQIDVFQAKNDFQAGCKSMHSGHYEELFFSKGAFIIPFSGEQRRDALLISIIYDYNHSHELSILNQIKTDVYCVMEKIDINCDKLMEPKIVQYLGKSVRYGWPTYLEIADSGGFYSFEYVVENEASEILNNDDFNIYVWPYLPDPATFFEQVHAMANRNDTNAVRKFVSDGGGFIGTCYGAYAASSGFLLPGVVNSLRLAYTPNQRRITPGTCLAISDSIMTVNFRVFTELIQVTNKILKPDHQLFYSINGTIPDFFKSPLFIWTGKNTEVLTVFDGVKTFLGDPINDSYTERILAGKPGFITSKFGNGEVVLFSSHPDFVNNITPLFSEEIKWDGDRYYGRRVIFNSFFYVSSAKNIKPDFLFGCTESFVNAVVSKTEDLQINDSPDDVFGEIDDDLDTLHMKLSSLNETLQTIIELFTLFLEDSTFFPDSYRFFVYSSALTSILKNYINNTHTSLTTLNKIIPLVYEYNGSVVDRVGMLKEDLVKRIARANELVDNAVMTAQNIKEILESDRISLLQKIDLLKERRELLSNFDIGLKYVPQLFFNSEKLLRSLWYDYESHIALC